MKNKNEEGERTKQSVSGKEHDKVYIDLSAVTSSKIYKFCRSLALSVFLSEHSTR